MDVSFIVGAFKSFVFSFIAYAAIFSGLAFLNEKFLPVQLAGLYERTNFFMRFAGFLLVFSVIANFLMFRAFVVAPPSVAGPGLMAAIVIIAVINAMILDKVSLTLPVFAATALAVFACGLVSWLLAGQKV